MTEDPSPAPDAPAAAATTDRDDRDDRIGAAEGAGTSRLWVNLLIAFTAGVLLVTATNAWVKRQMLDTDAWVRTSDQLLADDEIRAALSIFVVDELDAAIDVATQLERRLPQGLEGLSGPIAAALRGPAVEVVDRVLASRAARDVWTRANRRAHETFLVVVRDETRPEISTVDGTVTLELRGLVVALAERLGLPPTAVARIPDDAGRLVVLESEPLADVQQAVRLIEWASVLLALVIAGLFGAAVILARGWRRVAIRHIGLALVIDSLILFGVQRLARAHLLDNDVSAPSYRPAVANAWWIATGLLRDIAWSGMVLGGLVLLATALVGPARPAASLRRLVGPTLLANRGTTWTIVAIVILALAAWTPFDTLSVGFGLIMIAAVLIASVGAFMWACARESDDVEIVSEAPRSAHDDLVR